MAEITQNALDELMAESVYDYDSVVFAQAKPKCGDANYDGCNGTRSISCCAYGTDGLVKCQATMSYFPAPSTSVGCSHNGSGNACWVGGNTATANGYPSPTAGGWFGQGSWSGKGFSIWVICANSHWRMFIKWADVDGAGRPLCDPSAYGTAGWCGNGWQCTTNFNTGCASLCSAQEVCPGSHDGDGNLYTTLIVSGVTVVYDCTSPCVYMRVNLTFDDPT